MKNYAQAVRLIAETAFDVEPYYSRSYSEMIKLAAAIYNVAVEQVAEDTQVIMRRNSIELSHGLVSAYNRTNNNI